MKKQGYFLFCIALVLGQLALAQQGRYSMSLTPAVGVASLYGDLDDRFLYTAQGLKYLQRNDLSFSLRFDASISRGTTFYLRAQRATFSGNDRRVDFEGNLLENANLERSLNHFTRLTSAGFGVGFHTDNGRLSSTNALIAFSLSAGIEVARFRVWADLGTPDTRYFYWSDGTIRTGPENAGAQFATIEQDGRFETNVTDLDTETNYRRTVLLFPIELALKLRLSEAVRLRFAYSYAFTDTDYLDDVSGPYRESYSSNLQAFAANPTGRTAELRGNDNGNDRLGMVSVGLVIGLGRERTVFSGPRFYTRTSGHQPVPLPRNEATDTVRTTQKAPIQPDSAANALSRREQLVDSLRLRYEEMWYQREIERMTTGEYSGLPTDTLPTQPLEAPPLPNPNRPTTDSIKTSPGDSLLLNYAPDPQVTDSVKQLLSDSSLPADTPADSTGRATQRPVGYNATEDSSKKNDTGSAEENEDDASGNDSSSDEAGAIRQTGSATVRDEEGAWIGPATVAAAEVDSSDQDNSERSATDLRTDSVDANTRRCTIYFAVNSHVLSDSTTAEVYRWCAELHPDTDTLAIQAFADSTGTVETNEVLMQKRAETVRQILVSRGWPEQKLAVEPGRIDRSTGTLAEARRVEIWITQR